ncbi:GNAT family N-acetyltransferase [Streptomyces sp. SID3343]|uniref:GNAT family N-acetyltransferase n=1 Tax=Streptomyces sp. SID3343 TaxID=2690260 RepID=UPI001370C576|nr:GNAT family N-acetyltransferase [Streptomyces sp. SID3343]MYV97239.1 GNAT family N-acetyltransferase [Streptomyces sp. SID3343]
MVDLSVRRADTEDHAALERLWLMFSHDLSEFRDQLPRPDGTFRNERLRSAVNDPDWAAYLLTLGERPVGFALVRGLSGPTRVMNSFFVVRGAQRTGIGLRAVREVVAEHPGLWEVAFQDDNPTAVRFWRRVATALADTTWTEEHRLVPNRPDLPPDVWITFATPA